MSEQPTTSHNKSHKPTTTHNNVTHKKLPVDPAGSLGTPRIPAYPPQNPCGPPRTPAEPPQISADTTDPHTATSNPYGPLWTPAELPQVPAESPQIPVDPCRPPETPVIPLDPCGPLLTQHQSLRTRQTHCKFLWTHTNPPQIPADLRLYPKEPRVTRTDICGPRSTATATLNPHGPVDLNTYCNRHLTLDI